MRNWHWIDVLAFLFILLVLSGVIVAKYMEWTDMRKPYGTEIIPVSPTVWKN